MDEAALVREVLFVMNIDGVHLKWDDERDAFVLPPTLPVAPATRQLVGRLAELGWMCRAQRGTLRRAARDAHALPYARRYRQLDSYVHAPAAGAAAGLVPQALRHGLQTELREWFQLIAVLEAQRQSELTLVQLLVWSAEPMQRLIAMVQLVKGCGHLKGGAMCVAMRTYERHGDPALEARPQRALLPAAHLAASLSPRLVSPHANTNPTRRHLRSGAWFNERATRKSRSVGPNSGPGGIVAAAHRASHHHPCHPTADLARRSPAPPPCAQLLRRASALSSSGSAPGCCAASSTTPQFFFQRAVPNERLWAERYALRDEMLPGFIAKPLAAQALLVGKAINFIRLCCHDAQWTVADDTSGGSGAAVDSLGRLEYGQEEQLQVFVSSAAARANAHLLRLVRGKYMLRQHCANIKHFVLLGKGDFVQYLMEHLGPQLKTDVALHRHRPLLETAVCRAHPRAAAAARRATTCSTTSTSSCSTTLSSGWTPSPSTIGWSRRCPSCSRRRDGAVPPGVHAAVAAQAGRAQPHRAVAEARDDGAPLRGCAPTL